MQQEFGVSGGMRNDAGSRSPRCGVVARNGTSSKLMRVLSGYLRSVSSNAGNIAATVRTAGAVAVTATQVDDEKHREQVQWASLDTLEVGPALSRHVLLLTYLNGFQVWDVEDANDFRELVSKRDGRAAFLRLLPLTDSQEGELKDFQPLVLVVTGDHGRGIPGSNGTVSRTVHSQFIPTVVRFYSLKTHSYVKELRFRTAICAVRCSRRLIAVALSSQIYCYDSATLQNTFSVLTYSTPNSGVGGYGALAVGPRWMAYAANQPIMSSAGRISPQHLASPGISPSTSPANGGLVAHYAKESSKQLAAGIMTLGDIGYKRLSKYCSEFLPDGVSPGSNGGSTESEFAGTVIVRDYVDKKIIAQFRAHSSPISALCFDPSGTLLVTASVFGHNLNVFRLTPNGDATGTKASFVHLYKLCRGLTNAVIQDISFSHDSHWISVSTSRGTSHLFAISPFGGVVGPHTHGTCSVDPFTGPVVVPTPAYPWWTSNGPLRVSQQAAPPPPAAITLSVVNRIKNGLGGWRGPGRNNGSSATTGAVAAGFHDGECSDSDQSGSYCLRDKLWVLCPSGYLTRYLLKPTTGSEAGYSTEGSSSPGQSQDLRLLVEASEKWDVCRRKDWLEREAQMESWTGQESEGERADDLSSSGSIKPEMKVEELQRWYMSNAEVQISQARPLPIWAKPNVYFHALLVKDNVDTEIENMPHHVVEIRRKDLKPLVERFDKLNHGNVNVTAEGIAVPKYRSLEPLIHRSSSGSSFGSEGPLGADSSCGSNGFHHNYQGYPDVYISATSPVMLQNDSFDIGVRSSAESIAIETASSNVEQAVASSVSHEPGLALDTDTAGVKSESGSAETGSAENEVENEVERDEVWEGAMFPFCEED